MEQLIVPRYIQISDRLYNDLQLMIEYSLKTDSESGGMLIKGKHGRFGVASEQVGKDREIMLRPNETLYEGEMHYGSVHSHPQCVIGDFVLVDTERGRIPIKDVVVGDKVLSYGGVYREVIDKIKFPYRGIQTTVELVKVNGKNQKLTTTANHPYRVIRDGKEQWIKAQYLREGDLVLVPEYLTYTIALGNNSPVITFGNNSSMITVFTINFVAVAIKKVTNKYVNTYAIGLTIKGNNYDENSFVANGILTHNTERASTGDVTSFLADKNEKIMTVTGADRTVNMYFKTKKTPHGDYKQLIDEYTQDDMSEMAYAFDFLEYKGDTVLELQTQELKNYALSVTDETWTAEELADHLGLKGSTKYPADYAIKKYPKKEKAKDKDKDRKEKGKDDILEDAKRLLKKGYDWDEIIDVLTKKEVMDYSPRGKRSGRNPEWMPNQIFDTINWGKHGI